MASEEEREENKGGKASIIVIIYALPCLGQSFAVQKTFLELEHKTVL